MKIERYLVELYVYFGGQKYFNSLNKLYYSLSSLHIQSLKFIACYSLQ